MAFGDMFRKKLGDAATLPEKIFDDVPASLQKTAGATGDEEPKKKATTSRERPVKAAAPVPPKPPAKPPVKQPDTFADIARGDRGMTVNDTQFDEDGTGWADPEKGDLERFWVNAFALEEAEGKGPKAYAAKLKELGLKNKDDWYRVREAFTEAHQGDANWQQSMINARMAGVKQQMSAAANAKGGLFDPVEGVTLEQYATVQARRAKLSGAAEWPKLLAEYGMDEAKWTQVDKVFMARMSDPSDPMATAAFATEYGKFFSAAASGQFAEGAKAGAKGMGLDSSHKKVKGAKEPVPFERYVEIMTAQDCWARAGKDVNAMLKKVFNMTAVDWSNLGAFWSQKLMADISLAGKLSELQDKYRPRYETAEKDDDLEV